MNGGIECEKCTDTSTNGYCDSITTLATYNISAVEDSCDRGNPNGIGSLFCEKTCDDNLGGFCPNENEYQNCNTNGCPGNIMPEIAQVILLPATLVEAGLKVTFNVGWPRTDCWRGR